MPSDQTTNERVARSCGIEIWKEMTHAGKVWMRHPEEHEKIDRRGVRTLSIEFNPTMFPQDALLAAESYGLFDEERHGCELHRYGNAWHVVGYREPLASGTFCEVVCAAIKRLEEMGAAGGNGTNLPKQETRQ